jgi:hypothetical protein
MNPEIKIKTDCFAYRPERMCKCLALRELYCEKEHCSFYKTMVQYMDDIKKFGSTK